MDEERWATMFTLSQASAAQNLAQMEQTREQEKKSWTTLFQASQEERRREREEDTAHREARERKRAGSDIPKQSALTDVSDLETFLNSFEGQMQLYDVHPDYWIANLLPLLSTQPLSASRKECQLTRSPTSDLSGPHYWTSTVSPAVTTECDGVTWRCKRRRHASSYGRG